MGRKRLEGDWEMTRHEVSQRWDELTDDDLDAVAGRRHRLIGRVHERYGISRREAARQVREWELARRRNSSR